MPDEAAALGGGGQNVGRLPRVGTTVVRPTGADSLAVQAFLRHLEFVGRCYDRNRRFDLSPALAALVRTESQRS